MPFAPTPPTLPDALAVAFEAAPVLPSDVPALFALVSACDTAVLGYPDVSIEDVESDSGPLPLGGERPQALVRRRDTDAVVSWWTTSPRLEGVRMFGDVFVDPSLPEDLADRIGAAGWATVLQWARDFFASGVVPLDADERRGTLVHTGSLRGDLATERRLAAAGFEQVRTFWRMSAPVPAEPPPAPDVPGLSIEPGTDLPLVHRLREESFNDHWGEVPESYESWVTRKTSEPGYDPSMWFVARIDGQPAGFMICSRQMASEDAVYVATLGTLTAYRRRGVAAALLHRAAQVARDTGFGSLRLSVDSANTSGAPSVYQKAGYHVIFAMNAWERRLEPAVS